MPPNHKGDREARISQAIEAIHNNNSPSIRAAARAYDVPYSVGISAPRAVSRDLSVYLIMIKRNLCTRSWQHGIENFLPDR
jgi:hypothetical protein